MRAVAVILACASVVGGSLSPLARCKADGVGEGSEIEVTGTYVNVGYGYSVRVPRGFKAYRTKAPAPNHGIGVDIGNRGDSIWVDASYDALDLGSTEALASHGTAEAMSRLPGLAVTSRSQFRLSGLDARDITLERKDARTGITYVRTISAFRPVPRGTAILYTVEMETHERSETAEAAFSEILRSFRLRSLPR